MKYSYFRRTLLLAIISFSAACFAAESATTKKWTPPTPKASSSVQGYLSFLWAKLKNQPKVINTLFEVRDTSVITVNECLSGNLSSNTRSDISANLAVDPDLVQEKVDGIIGEAKDFFSDIHTRANQIFIGNIIRNVISNALKDGGLKPSHSILLKFIRAKKSAVPKFFSKEVVNEKQLISLGKEVCVLLDTLFENMPEMKRRRQKRVAATLLAAKAVKVNVPGKSGA